MPRDRVTPHSPFHRGVAGALAAGGILSFAIAIAAWTFAPPDAEVRSAQADAYSRSALGHKALVEWLRKLGVPVVVSRYDSARRAGSSAALALIEPRLEKHDGKTVPADVKRLEQALGDAASVLLVLPKWVGEEDPDAAGWLRSVASVPLADAQDVLDSAKVRAKVIRPGEDTALDCAGTLRHPQLLRADDALTALVSCGDGVLLAEVKRAKGRLVVLSDPDLLANHGLAEGRNAELVWQAIGKVRGEHGTLVVDETLHGYERYPSLWRDLFTFPLWPATLTAALAVAAALAAGSQRFGAPLPVRMGLDPGTATLVASTAALLGRGRHLSFALGHYLDGTIQDLARALHIPGAVSASERLARLRRIGERRRVEVDIDRIAIAVEAARGDDSLSAGRAVTLARALHRFREEVLRGAG